MYAPVLFLALFTSLGLLLIVFAPSVARLLRSLSVIVFRHPVQQWPWAKAMVELVFNPRRLPAIVRTLGVVYVATGALLYAFIRLLLRRG
jgi:hypothetical protein